MATAAYSKGRRRLATLILDIVQNPVDQVSKGFVVLH
jgi:hypothetical protein